MDTPENVVAVDDGTAHQRALSCVDSRDSRGRVSAPHSAKRPVLERVFALAGVTENGGKGTKRIGSSGDRDIG